MTNKTEQLNKDYEYKFSIIMGVYNVEAYIAEAIDSLIEQDIGFEENVQLILIDDGSPDNSGKICDEYASRYPKNIISLHKENGGVSSARNLGLKYAKGKYYNFMDSDDRLSSNTLTDVETFFDIYKERVDIISIPFEFFERATGRNIPHNRKFANGNRIIDLNTEYDVFQFSLGASFVRAEACKNMCFDETLILSEDAKEIYKLFLDKPYLGICESACYYYRKRAASNSAVDSSQKKASCYTYHLKQHYLFMVNNYLKKYGFVPKFVQYAIMYDLQWKIRLQHFPKGVLTEKEIAEFKKELKHLLSYIDNDIILSMKDLTPAQKNFTLNFKDPSLCKIKEHFKDTQIYIECKDEEQNIVQTPVMYASGSPTIIDFISFKNGILEIEGAASVPKSVDDYDFEVLAKVNDRVLKCENYIRNTICSLDEVSETQIGFKFSFAPIDEIETYSISFFVNYYGNLVILKNIKFGNYAPLTLNLKNSFYYAKPRILTFDKGCFTFKMAGKKALIKSECALRKEMKAKNFYCYKEIFKLRTKYYLHNLFSKKPIWLISDRMNGADDNGEAFYLYMKKNKKIRSYFVIDKASKKKAKKLGKVITIGSRKHFLYSLLAEKVVSSQLERQTLYVYKYNADSIRDLYAPKRFVFLQHGILFSDCSTYLNKYSKNISLFISSCQREYDSLLSCKYDFMPENIALTGLTRFDRLYNDDKKVITIMPTWRSSLAEPYDTKTGEWKYENDFTESDFYKFYNSLLNNEKLLCALEQKGYKLAFAPHPNLKNVVSLFDTSKVLLWQGKKYRDIFAMSSLIVTDYSSAVSDFAYLNKPIIYSQFDKNVFYKTHSYDEGYFDYESMGFGEVEYSFDGLVDKIIEYVDNDCAIKDEYKERIDNFFAFRDQNNCKRVYEAITGKYE